MVDLKQRIAAGVVALSATASAAAKNLPPLPSHASGVECTAVDGIDRTDPDFMRKKLDAVIKSGEINQPGWKVEAHAYKIPYMVSTHSNIEIIKPNGDMFASLDTQNIDRTNGSIGGYFPGKYAAPVIDDCQLGNSVVNKDNFQSRKLLMEGTGNEALVGFARVTERAAGYSHQNFEYSWRSGMKIGSNETVNSNSYARALAKTDLGEKGHGVDIAPEFNKLSFLGAPGLGIDLAADPKRTPKGSFYDTLPSTKDFTNSPKYVERFLADMKELHPIMQQHHAIDLGRQQQTQPVAP